MLCFLRLVIALPQSFPFSKLHLHNDKIVTGSWRWGGTDRSPTRPHTAVWCQDCKYPASLFSPVLFCLDGDCLGFVVGLRVS